MTEKQRTEVRGQRTEEQKHKKARRRKSFSFIVALVLLFSVFCSLFSVFCFAQDWQEARGDHFIVYYQEPSKTFAADVLRQAEYYYAQVASDLGYVRYSNFWQWENRVKIFIYPDQASFLEATGQPSWSTGNANYLTKQITGFSGSQGFLNGILPHEIAHLIFRDFVGFKGEVPLWLDEGVAQWQEKPKREAVNAFTKTLFQQNELMPLRQLTRLDVRKVTEGAQAQNFYIQAASLVGFLIRQYGADNFTQFCRQLRDGKNLDDALRFIYSSRIASLDDLEKKWLKYVSEIK